MTADVLVLSRLRLQIETGEARAIRERARLSLPEFATHCGVTHTTMQRWERGERRPRGDAALRYASLLAELEARFEAPGPTCFCKTESGLDAPTLVSPIPQIPQNPLGGSPGVLYDACSVADRLVAMAPRLTPERAMLLHNLFASEAP